MVEVFRLQNDWRCDEVQSGGAAILPARNSTPNSKPTFRGIAAGSHRWESIPSPCADNGDAGASGGDWSNTFTEKGIPGVM